jgi:hypothetical protein
MHVEHLVHIVVENAVMDATFSNMFFPFLFVCVCVCSLTYTRPSSIHKVVRVIIVSLNECKVRESEVDGRKEKNVVYVPKCR